MSEQFSQPNNTKEQEVDPVTSPEKGPDSTPDAESAEQRVDKKTESPEVESPEKEEGVESAEDQLEALEKECPQIAMLSRVSEDMDRIEEFKTALAELEAYKPDISLASFTVGYNLDTKKVEVETSAISKLQRDIDDATTQSQNASGYLLATKKPGLFSSKAQKAEYQGHVEQKEVALKEIEYKTGLRDKVADVHGGLSRKIHRATPPSFPQMITTPIPVEQFAKDLRAELTLSEAIRSMYPNRDDLVSRYKKIHDQLAAESAAKFQS